MYFIEQVGKANAAMVCTHKKLLYVHAYSSLLTSDVLDTSKKEWRQVDDIGIVENVQETSLDTGIHEKH